jgi:hypothetical protein
VTLACVAKGGKRANKGKRVILDTWGYKVRKAQMEHEEIQANKDCEDIEANKVTLEKREKRE